MKRKLYRIAWKHENGSFGAGEWHQKKFKSFLKKQVKTSNAIWDGKMDFKKKKKTIEVENYGKRL